MLNQTLLSLFFLLSLFAFSCTNKGGEATDSDENRGKILESVKAYIKENRPDIILSDSTVWGKDKLMQGYKNSVGFKEYWIDFVTNVTITKTEDPTEEQFLEYQSKIESGELPGDAEPPQPKITEVIEKLKVTAKLDTAYQVKEIKLPEVQQ